MKIFYKEAKSGCRITYQQLVEHIAKPNQCPSIEGRAGVVLFIVSRLASGIDCKLPVDHTTGDNEAGGSFERIGQAISPDQIYDQIVSAGATLSLRTTGTTGIPKEIVHPVPQLVSGVKRADRYSEATWGMGYNVSHMGGIQVLFQALGNTSTVIDLHGCSPDQAIDEMEQEGISHLSATPTYFRLLPTGRSLPSVRHVTCGGEPLSESTFQHIQKLFPRASIRNIYASTEMGQILTSNGLYFSVEALTASSGMIKDGQLCFRKDKNDQWIASGDIIEFVDTDRSMFQIVGRQSDRVNIGGQLVNISAVEEQLRRLPGIKLAVVKVRKNSVLGNILTARVTVTEGARLVEKDIRTLLMEQGIASHSIPATIKIVDTLVVNQNQKLVRS